MNIAIPSPVKLQTRRFVIGALLTLLTAVFFLKPVHAAELLSNGNFESGSTGWTLNGAVVSTGANPHGGSGYALLGNIDNQADTLFQVVTVPADAVSPTLSYYFSIGSQDTSTTARDRLMVNVQTVSCGFLGQVASYSNLQKDPSPTAAQYRNATYDMSSFKGQTVRINFFANTDGSMPTDFRIDDVSITYTVAPAPAPIVSVPPTVGTLAATNAASTTATLNGTINPNGSYAGWFFQYGTSSAFGSTTSSMTTGVSSSAIPISANLEGLAPGTAYFFRVVGVGGGTSVYGETTSFLTSYVPHAVQNFRVTTSPSGAISMGWNGGEGGAIYYGVERSMDGSPFDGIGGFSTDPGYIASGNDNGYSTSGLPGHRYCFRVVTSWFGGEETTGESRCVDVAGPSSSSSGAPSTSLPIAPSNLTAQVQSSSRITLTWRDNANNETGFRVAGGTSGAPIAQLGTPTASAGTGSSASFDAMGLASGATYCFAVSAVNAAGESSGNPAACATTSSQITVQPAGTTLPANNITSSSATLRATVNPNGASAGAFFEWGTSQSFGNYTPNQTLGSGTSVLNVSADRSGLLPSTTYYYRVVVTTVSGGTITGQTLSFTMPAAAAPVVNTPPPVTPSLAAPTNLQAAYSTAYGSYVNISWVATNPNALSTLERGSNGGSYITISTMYVPTGYRDTGALPGNIYCYRVKISYGGADSEYSQTACATVPVAQTPAPPSPVTPALISPPIVPPPQNGASSSSSQSDDRLVLMETVKARMILLVGAINDWDNKDKIRQINEIILRMPALGRDVYARGMNQIDIVAKDRVQELGYLTEAKILLDQDNVEEAKKKIAVADTLVKNRRETLALGLILMENGWETIEKTMNTEIFFLLNLCRIEGDLLDAGALCDSSLDIADIIGEPDALTRNKKLLMLAIKQIDSCSVNVDASLGAESELGSTQVVNNFTRWIENPYFRTVVDETIGNKNIKNEVEKLARCQSPYKLNIRVTLDSITVEPGMEAYKVPEGLADTLSGESGKNLLSFALTYIFTPVTHAIQPMVIMSQFFK